MNICTFSSAMNVDSVGLSGTLDPRGKQALKPIWLFVGRRHPIRKKFDSEFLFQIRENSSATERGGESSLVLAKHLCEGHNNNYQEEN